MKIEIFALENFCANSCFLVLLLTTFFYWANNLFVETINYSGIGRLGHSLALFFLTSLLLLRWVSSGHFPLSNLYESLIFLGWCLVAFQIYLEKTSKNLFLGVLTTPVILCIIAFTDFSLPLELQKSSSLVPALQSNWLIMHVSVMIASYAALLIGCLIAIAYLIFVNFFSTDDKFQNSDSSKNFEISSESADTTAWQTRFSPSLYSSSISILPLENSSIVPVSEKSDISSSNQKNTEKVQISQNSFLFFLDNLSYRAIGIGFCFLTLGILSGAVWANETWGSYWSWDPKETWALITWLTFASYLHSRLLVGWTGKKPALIATFGFIIVWICYLGVNLLGQGLHSYGFLKAGI